MIYPEGTLKNMKSLESIVSKSTGSPEWLRVEQVQALYGLSRSKVFELVREDQVTAASLLSPGKSRGVRLISRESLDELISASITTSNRENQE